MSDTPLPPGMRDVALGRLLAAWSATLYENPVDVEIYQHGTRINGRPPLSETEVYDLLRKRVIELSVPDGSDTDEPAPSPVRAPNDPLLNVGATLLAVYDDVRELLKRVPSLDADANECHLRLEYSGRMLSLMFQERIFTLEHISSIRQGDARDIAGRIAARLGLEIRER